MRYKDLDAVSCICSAFHWFCVHANEHPYLPRALRKAPMRLFF